MSAGNVNGHTPKLLGLPSNVLAQVVSHLDGRSRRCLKLISRTPELQDLVNDSVTTLRVPAAKLSDEFCSRLRGLFPKIRHASVQAYSFHTVQAAFLQSAPLWPLETLQLSCTFLSSDDMLAVTASCTQLKAIRLSGSEDPNLGIMREPKGLELSCLANLRHLKQLHIGWRTEYSGNLNWLTALASLATLHVNCFDRHLQPVLALTPLKKLTLSVACLEHAVVDLNTMTTLEELSLELLGFPVPSLIFPARIRRLALCTSTLPEGLLAELGSRLPMLQHLTLQRVNLPGSQPVSQGSFAALERLVLAELPLVSLVNLCQQLLQEPLSRLRDLLVLLATDFEDGAGTLYRMLARHPSLQRLIVPIASAEEPCRELAEGLRDLHHLRHLCLCGEPDPKHLLLVKAALGQQLPSSCLRIHPSPLDTYSGLEELRSLTEGFCDADLLSDLCGCRWNRSLPPSL